MDGESLRLLLQSRTRVLDLRSRSDVAAIARWCGSASEGLEGEASLLDLHLCRLSTLDLSEENLGHVVHVDCSVNYLKHLPRIGIAPKLFGLDLSLNQLETFRRLDCPRLRTLNLSRNRLRDVNLDCLDGLPNLEVLDLSGNLIESLESFPRSSQLRKLYLRDNRVEIVERIDECIALEELDLSKNFVSDFLQLANHPSLRVLDLSGNRIDDLDETHDIVRTMPALREVKFSGNPIASQEANYRMRILENPFIEKLDNRRVSQATREEWRASGVQRNLDEVIERTTRVYMDWIEREEKHKDKVINILRKREAAIEAAFRDYKTLMESELEDCVSYLQQLHQQPNLHAQSFLTDVDGQRFLADILAKAECARDQTYAEETAKLELDFEEQINLKSDVVAYLDKLKQISLHRPSLWNEIKHRELGGLQAEEVMDEGEREELAEYKDQSDALIAKRASRRNNLFLGVANQFRPNLL